MQTTMFDLERIISCSKTYGASISKGESGIIVNGQSMDAKMIFSGTGSAMNVTQSVKSEEFSDSSCSLDGFATDSYVGLDDAKIAVLAA